MKDYYKIMNLPYDASADEIRQAYHRFAKKYHPDKNGGQAANALFLDIQEAYHTLSDERRRRIFHAKTHYPFPSKKTTPPVTAENILYKCQLLNEKIKGMNKYHINLKLISQTIDAILSEKNIAVVQAEKNTWITQKITDQIVLAMSVLPYRFIVGNTNKLLRLSSNSQEIQKQVLAFGNRKRKLLFWEKYNLVIVLLATLVICLLIVYLSE